MAGSLLSAGSGHSGFSGLRRWQKAVNLPEL